MKCLYTLLLSFFILSALAQSQTEKSCIQEIQKLTYDEEFASALTLASRCKQTYPNSQKILESYGQILIELKSDYYHSNSDLELFYEFRNLINQELKKFPEDSTLIHVLSIVTYDKSSRLIELEEEERGIQELNYFLSTYQNQALLIQDFIIETTLNLLTKNKIDQAMKEIDLLLYSNIYGIDPDTLLVQILEDKLSKNDVVSVNLLYKLLGRKFPNQIAYTDQLICARLTEFNSGKPSIEKVKSLQQLSHDFRACKELKSIEKADLINMIKSSLNSSDYSKAGMVFRLAKLNFRNDKDILQLKRKWVLLDYNANYKIKSLSVDELKWTGSIENCEAGVVAVNSHKMVEDRVNYFRRLAGLRDSCKIDYELNIIAQEAALIMASNRKLSHFPGKNWGCYSIEGYQGASKANLSLGNHSIYAVTSQMEDEGDNNNGVGHRRWILYPELDVIGHGSTNSTQALVVIDKSLNYQSNSKLDFIAWPPEHYVPQGILFRRWSFSFEGADFENVRVEMKNNNNSVPLRVEPLDNPGGGENSVVWIPDLSRTDRTKPYLVTISNVNARHLSRKERVFKYTVEILHEE